MEPVPGATELWTNPDDPAELRVWADMLLERGDVRGELVHLSLLAERDEAQQARYQAIRNLHGAKIVGPARPYLRTWIIGDQGLVTSVTTEAKLFVEGFELIRQLHPRLQITVTAMRTKPLIARMATLPLGRIHYLLLEWTGMTDATLAALGPALRGIRNLSLAFNDVTAKGLRVLAPHVETLEYLALGTSLKQRADGVAIGNGWIDVLCELPAFHNLRALTLFNYASPPTPQNKARLAALPKLASITYKQPHYSLGDLERAKTARS